MSPLTTTLLAAAEQTTEDIGKAGPVGLLLTVLIGISIVLLVRSMTRHLKRVPASFDRRDEPPIDVPDDAAELLDPPPGNQLLDDLRRAPRAIEPPRERGDGDARA